MTSRAGSIIAWSSYNYPIDINASDVSGAEEVQLSYGPDRQRWKQIYTAPGTTENTYYIGGLLEKVLSGSTTNYRHYIYAGREAIAVYSRTATKAFRPLECGAIRPLGRALRPQETSTQLRA